MTAGIRLDHRRVARRTKCLCTGNRRPRDPDRQRPVGDRARGRDSAATCRRASDHMIAGVEPDIRRGRAAGDRPGGRGTHRTAVDRRRGQDLIRLGDAECSVIGAEHRERHAVQSLPAPAAGRCLTPPSRISAVERRGGGLAAQVGRLSFRHRRD